MTAAFQFDYPTRLVFGEGTSGRAGELAVGLGAKTVLLVSDPGLVRAGHVSRMVAVLETAGLDVVVFDQVHENPTTDDVDACLAAAQGRGIDLIVGLGGGSSLDTAKGCNFLLTNGGRMQDYWGLGKATRPMLPLIAIPTTAGTGSEAQSFALIADAKTHQKMACGDRKALAAVAILDPALAASQPRSVIACSGLDSVAHAVETAVTRPRHPVSVMLSREAFRLAQANLPRVLADPGDLEAQGRMMLAANLGGAAIESSMLGAAHSMANPLTAEFGVTHGQAVGTCLPHVVGFNAAEPAAESAYAALAHAAGLAGANGRGGAPGRGETPIPRLVDRLHELLDAAGMPRTLSACGVPRSAARSLAEDAARQWTAQFNPRTVGVDDFERLYEAVIEGVPARAVGGGP